MTAFEELEEEETEIHMDRRTPGALREVRPWAPFILTLLTLIGGWVLGIGRTDAATTERLRLVESRMGQIELTTVKKDEYDTKMLGLQQQLDAIRDDTRYVRTRLDQMGSRGGR